MEVPNKTIMKKILLLFVMLAFGLTSFTQSAIKARVYDPPVDQSWNNTASWEGGFIPQASDCVIIPNNAIITIQSSDIVTVRCMTVESGGTLNNLGDLTLELDITLEDDEVINPLTCRIWKDKNLGASQVATSSTDAAAYGDLYQWGRATEGHELRTSELTDILATTSIPGTGGNAWDGKFITSSNDWLETSDDNLWQGVNGVNNPCPNGFRLPTDTEWTVEKNSWGSQNSTGAFNSVLKLTVGGNRDNHSGSLLSVGVSGQYWSSSVDQQFTEFLNITSSSASTSPTLRAKGFSVRCIKD